MAEFLGEQEPMERTFEFAFTWAEMHDILAYLDRVNRLMTHHFPNPAIEALRHVFIQAQVSAAV